MAESITSFRDLIAWQKAIELVDRVYRLTRAFPKTELFGLVTQMRRAAVSVPSNIAEGYGRRRLPEYLRFLDVARGSLCELQTQVVISYRQRLMPAEDHQDIQARMDEVSRLLYGLTASLKKKMD